MADEQQLKIILEDGVHSWNAWRAENPQIRTDLAGANLSSKYLRSANLENTDLEGADLSNADLHSANLAGANLAGANLTNANCQQANLSAAKLLHAVLKQANLNQATLTNADLSGADLEGAELKKTDLVDANFRGANFVSVNFETAKISSGTLGLGRLSVNQRGSMQLVNVEPVSDLAQEETDVQISDEADAPASDSERPKADAPGNVTVVNATKVVGTASSILETLAIPNEPDFTEEHRELVRELQRVVSELNAELGKVVDQDKRLSEEPEVLKKVQEAMPVWRITWQTFVAGVAGGVVGLGTGYSTAFAAGYTAGFIAGVLHDTFSPAESCLL